MAHTKRGVTSEDILALAVPLDPRVSPDGREVAFALRTADRETRKTRVHIRVGAPGGPARALTDGPFKDSAPRWSPDGARIAFFTTRPAAGAPPAGKDRTQVAVVAAGGGEPVVLIDVDASLADLTWTPDGKLLFAMRRNDPVPPGESAPLAIRVTSLRYKLNGAGYHPSDRYHIYELDPATRAMRALTEGAWDDTAPTPSPDGRQIAFLSNRRADREEDDQNLDLWVMGAHGGEARQLSRLRGGAWSPVWTGDGATLLFVEEPGERGNFLLDNAHVFAVPADGSAPERDLTPDLDRCAMHLTMSDTVGIDTLAPPPALSADGRHVLFAVSDSGRTFLARAPLAGGAIEPVFARETVAAVHQARPGGPIALLLIDHANPGTVALAGPDGREPELVCDPNAAWLAEVDVAEPEELSVTPEDGVPIQAWLLKPRGTGPHPLLLYIHGGPVFQYGHGFFHELQMLRAMGFAVVYGNPRGSQGYGVGFARAIHRDFGTRPMVDVMALVDSALARGGLDRARLGVLGGSYGGYLTLWIIGHTDRFAAACAQRPLAWCEGMIWSDFGGYLGDWLGALPWEDPELYRFMSPLTYAQNVRTPLLITQGLDDLRTPPDQGERAFVMLKRMGKPVEMVLFPGADHDLSRKGRPDQRIARLEAIAEFMRRHLLSGV